VKYAFINQHNRVWPIRAMCRVLGASSSGFYEWRTRGPSVRARANAQLSARIRESFEQSEHTYGSPRVWRDLKDWGECCGKNRVARLMRQARLRARHKRRCAPRDRHTRVEHSIAPNLLQRQFKASAVNQKWVADFTYVWTGRGWLFVAAVMDLYSRRIVGWSMHQSMTAQLVIDALMMALWRRGQPSPLLHHSDQGSQYTSDDFQRLLAQQGISCSMSRRGDCWDNAVMESFFSTMKTERINRRHYLTPDEARADIFDYIERFYNARRRHSTIGYVSPMQFEQRLMC
jgi:putative transposase